LNQFGTHYTIQTQIAAKREVNQNAKKERTLIVGVQGSANTPCGTLTVRGCGW